MSIITRKVCKCGQPYMSVKHSTQCDMCSRGNVKNVVCAYHGMLISFRMLDSAVGAFVKILHDNGALSIEVLRFD